MKNFNYIEREFVNPVSLETIGRTFNTLEQGHKEAVKAASDLQVTMANLDLNEAEAGWRQGKIAEIRQTVADNSNYGNAYGALDDLIAQAGNIASDPGMIGRLQAQKDYKSFREQLDKRTDIPEAYKDMFREENKYFYQDKTDDTGKIVGGTKWEAVSNPTSTVNYFDVMKQGLSIAARESGGGSAVRFLDANGRVTTDPGASATGEVYDESTSRWERLSPDKIRAGIKSALESTPGAKASLEQDYKYNNWKYDKDVKANNGKPVVQEGVTDRKGNLLDFDDFIEYKTGNFVNASKYNNVTSSRSMGTALQSHKAMQAQKAAQAGMGMLGNLLGGGNASGAGGGVTIGTVETDVNNYASTINGKSGANSNALNILKKYSPTTAKGFDSVSDFIQWQRNTTKASGPGTAVTNYIKWIERNGSKMSAEDKTTLFNATMGYYNYDQASRKIEQKLSPKDREALRFSSSVANQDYQVGRSVYDDNIVKTNNQLWKDIDNMSISLSPNLVKSLSRNLGVTNLRELGLEVTANGDDTVINFTSADRNFLPKFMSILDKSDSQVGVSARGLRNAIYGDGNKDYQVKMFKNGKSGWEVGGRKLLNTLKNNYDSGLNKAASVEKAAGVNKGVISVESSGRGSFRDLELQSILNAGGMKPSEYNTYSKIANENVDNSFANASFDAGRLYNAGDGNHFDKVDNPQDMQNLIQFMYTSHPDKIKRSTVVMSGVPDAVKGGNVPMSGYVMTFTAPKDAPGKAGGKSFKVMYAGNLQEDTSSDPATSTGNVAYNVYNSAKATNTDAQMLEYDNYLGNTNVSKGKDGHYYANFAGSSKKVNDAQAAEYLKTLYTLQQTKHVVQSGMMINPESLNATMITLINNIAGYTGKDPQSVRQSINNYLVK